jgi:hypothetical protein
LGAEARAAEAASASQAAMRPSWLDSMSEAAVAPMAASRLENEEPLEEPSAEMPPAAATPPPGESPGGGIPEWMQAAGWAQGSGEVREGPVSFSDDELRSLEAGMVPPEAAPEPEGGLVRAQIPDWLKEVAPPAAEEMEVAEGEVSPPAAAVSMTGLNEPIPLARPRKMTTGSSPRPKRLLPCLPGWRSSRQALPRLSSLGSAIEARGQPLSGRPKRCHPQQSLPHRPRQKSRRLEQNSPNGWQSKPPRSKRQPRRQEAGPPQRAGSLALLKRPQRARRSPLRKFLGPASRKANRSRPGCTRRRRLRQRPSRAPCLIGWNLSPEPRAHLESALARRRPPNGWLRSPRDRSPLRRHPRNLPGRRSDGCASWPRRNHRHPGRERLNRPSQHRLPG